MKQLVCTTAVAALMALPALAQDTTTGQQGTGQVQMQDSRTAEAGQMEIEASQLIGKRLYIAREGEGMMQPEARPQDGMAQQSGAGAGMVAPEGAETAGAAQPMQEGQVAGAAEPQAQDGQPVQEDRMAEVPAGQMQGDGAMTEGVTDPRARWQTAGQIRDVLLSGDGQVQALTVDAGGFLGGGQGARRIDIRDVRFVPHAGEPGEFFVVYSGDRQMLEAAQTFDEAQMQEGIRRGTEMWGEEMRGREADVAFTSITSDDLLGTSVYGPGDEWVGDVTDLALTESGEIEAIVVDVGGFLGIGTRSVAMPMDEVQLRRGEGGWFGEDLRAYVNATEEQLEQLPEWNDG